MERPGLLELAVYALVLTAAAGWVYALPPFTHEPGGSMQVADMQPVSGQPVSAEAQGEESGAEIASVSRAIGEPPVEQSPTAEADAGDEPRPDPQPNLLVVTARSLNMRSEPNAGSALVGNYPRGARVEQVEKTGNWILVRTEDKVTGWMYAGYLGSADD
jgi:uncharacterized protein YgiM (DUF1202 family)